MPPHATARTMHAEILSQGDEVVTGQVADTNAAWLSTRLTELGFTVMRHTAVGDRLPDLVAALHEVSARADLVLCTGGLGPTDDDLTIEAVSQAFSVPLALDEVALVDLLAKYERFGRRMPEVNKKQVVLPVGCDRIDNDFGTAPGFAMSGPRAWMAFMPGVPREMKGMFDGRIVPRIVERFALRPGRLVTLRTTGCGESDLQERIGVGVGLPGGSDPFVLSFRTAMPENFVKLRFGPEVSDAEITAITAGIARKIGSHLFAVEGCPGPLDLPVDTEGGDLAAVIGHLLLRAGATLAVAESCTGGRIASMCTATAGSSAWFLEGAVTYANAAKVRALGVDPALLEAHGAVSEPVARAMAEGLRSRSGATWALATTGIAGPDGGTADKPVGTVHFAIAGPSGTTHRQVRLSGDRHRIQTLASATTLDLLRRQLAGPETP
jgi:nicotinamide-nucleotide amidase